MFLKALLFALLAGDTAYFVLIGATSKAIDAAAWLVLLTLFVAETRLQSRPARASFDVALRAVRLLAAAGVIVAMLRYVLEDNALDSINSALWIAVVVLLEVEFRYPLLVTRHRTAFVGVAIVLYGALGVLVVIWAWRAEWLDAYDALLWLIAFATLELDIVGARAPGKTLKRADTPLGGGWRSDRARIRRGN